MFLLVLKSWFIRKWVHRLRLLKERRQTHLNYENIVSSDWVDDLDLGLSVIKVAEMDVSQMLTEVLRNSVGKIRIGRSFVFRTKNNELSASIDGISA